MGKPILLTVVLLAVFVPPAAGTTWYVDGAVPESGDGQSWETAFKTIQEGIDVASHGDTVFVAQGTYVENIKFNGKNITLTSTDPLDPSVVANTVIDGNRAGSVVTFGGTEGEICQLSGFVIQNGWLERASGGGICGGSWSTPTHATITNNIVRGNEVGSSKGMPASGGGVAYCNGLIENNVISENRAIASGITIVVSSGGGLAECDGVIQNNTITGNAAIFGFGGGLAYCDGAVRSNRISGNLADGYGGGLCKCFGTIQNNIIVANTSESRGGGFGECDGEVLNNLIAGNSAKASGSAFARCHGTIQNNTIVGNTANDAGAALWQCSAAIRNCIIWGNSAGGSADQIVESNAPAFCCVQGWTNGSIGNIGDDPLFADPDGPDDSPETWEDNDYHPLWDSPCIDTGANYYWFLPRESDLDGNCRLSGERVDMGCYEHASSPDSDGDLLSDFDESAWGTNPLDEDSDEDGLRDGLEVLRGSNPMLATPPRTAHVPSQVQTIQEAVCLAVNGDLVVVAPGTYRETVHFCGANVSLRSSAPHDRQVVASTTIDACGLSSAVRFAGFETGACVLAGFTLTGGSGYVGGGVRGGKYPVLTGAAIRENVITGNKCRYSGGGLAHCGGVIEGNVITLNSGGDVMVFPYNYTGGLAGCDGPIRNNVVCYNRSDGVAGCDGNISNNTIVGNSGYGLGQCQGTVLNCIVWGNERGDLYQTASDHCWVSTDPKFVDAEKEDFRLRPDSPCIDAGFNSPDLPEFDIAGMHRIMFGGKSLTVDMGGYEFYINNLEPVTGTDEALFTWSSLEGKTYSIFYTDDLFNWHTAIHNFPSLGNQTTSWTDDGSLTGLPPLSVPRRFYRVLENP
jgi:hypothetical protein